MFYVNTTVHNNTINYIRSGANGNDANRSEYIRLFFCYFLVTTRRAKVATLPQRLCAVSRASDDLAQKKIKQID